MNEFHINKYSLDKICSFNFFKINRFESENFIGLEMENKIQIQK